MSKKMIKESHVLRNYTEGRLSRKAAAEALGLSERQITRKARKLKENGEASLVHGNTGRKPSSTLSEDRKQLIVGLKQNPIYTKANISHFHEILEKQHGITISYTALYNLLENAGIESPKKHGKPSKPHRRRKRKPSEGELIQIDATPYEWFGGDKKYALHGGIDDATSKLVGLYMTDNECLVGYYEMMRQTCKTKGIPLAVYSDKHTIFRSPKTEKLSEEGEEAPRTQFGRAMEELNIAIIYANSPQAKGRIERAWETLQSRLPVELAIRGITTLEAANEFLAVEYINMFNEKFAVPAEAEPIYVKCRSIDELDSILCIKEIRKTDRAGAFSFKGQYFKILDAGYPLVPAKAEITVSVSTRLGICASYNGRKYQTQAIEKPRRTSTPTKPKAQRISGRTVPNLLHSTDEWKALWHSESYEDTVAFLYDLFCKPSSLAQ